MDQTAMLAIYHQVSQTLSWALGKSRWSIWPASENQSVIPLLETPGEWSISRSQSENFYQKSKFFSHAFPSNTHAHIHFTPIMQAGMEPLIAPTCPPADARPYHANSDLYLARDHVSHHTPKTVIGADVCQCSLQLGRGKSVIMAQKRRSKEGA